MALQRSQETNPTKTNHEKLSCWWAMCLVAYMCLIVGLPFLAFFKLPNNLDSSTNPEEFNGVQAMDDLFDLLYYGPRPLGSIANEVTAVKFLSLRIEEIASQSNGLYRIEKDVQVASGHYNRFDRLNIYESIQNVIVKLTPANSNYSNALLINSHFDTVPGSPGAGDDGSMVAVMLGILNALTKSRTAVKHPIIFLFNGDEEKGLQASHAFITQHKWASDIRIFINLDGMGVGGKEMLFRSGPENSWLLNYYGKAAKYPFASVLGEELFENNLLPGDTDFTVFRDYGKLVGLDFAYIKNGYAYHTKLDQFSSVDEGTLQHTGENILALTRVLANANELNEEKVIKAAGKAVYFDVFGLFLISYSEKTGAAINYSICGIALIVIGISIWFMNRATEMPLCEVILQFIFSFGIYLGSLLTAAGLVCLVAYLIDYMGYSMAWFSKPWLIFGHYFCPFIFVMAIFPALLLAWKKFSVLPLNFGVLLFMHCNCIVLVILTLSLTALHIRSAFLITNVIIFYLLAIIINYATGTHNKHHRWILPIVICQSMPIAFNSYIMVIIYSVYIPVTGRNPSNPEVMIGLCTIGLSLLMFGFVVPIFSIFRGAKKIIFISLLVFVVCFLLIFLNFISFPYTNETPQRHSVYHTARKIHNSSGSIVYEDNIFLMFIADRHSVETLEDFAWRNFKEIYSGQEDIQQLQYYSDYHRWMQAPPIKFANPAKLTLLSKEELIPGETYRYTFTLSGPKMFRISINPIGDTSLVDWSFGSNVVDVAVEAKNKYDILILFGKDSPPYTFSMTLKISDPLQVVLSIGLQAQYLDETYTSGLELNKFIRSFPKWTTVTETLASYDTYTF